MIDQHFNMKTLNIAKEIQLPLDAVTQTMSMIGRKGSGKTYLATMIAESMLDAHAQVIAIDPVGNWWGLRVGADGKSKGKEIFVIGGDHGDVPLIPTAGARIAKLLVEKGISAVIDVSGFRIGEHKRFAAEFAEEFFHLKKSNRSPVHVFIEEAQKIIPQRVGPDEARMVGAFEQIVRLGRNYGIGCSLVTQRPQSVNKEVLSQVECLCVLQVTGPHERKALEEWVQEAGADRKLVGELPSLARGEGYVWSPAWLRIYKRVHFSSKQTFDASSTPEVGKKTRAASLSTVDVESLKADMADVVAEADKNNPVVLKNRITALEKLLVMKNGTLIEKEVQVAMGVSQWAEYGKKNGYWDFFVKKELTANDSRWQQASEHAIKNAIFIRDEEWGFVIQEWIDFSTNIYKVFRNSIDSMSRGLNDHSVEPKRQKPSEPEWSKNWFLKNPGTLKRFMSLPEPATSDYSKDFSIPSMKLTDDSRPLFFGGDKKLSKGAKSILSYLHSVFPKEKSKTQIWVVTGYSPGGGFNNLIYELAAKQLIYKTPTGFKGRANYLPELIDETFTVTLDKWYQKLSSGPRKIFEFMMNEPTAPKSKEELAQATGYAMGGGFNNNVYELTGAELIKKVPGGYIINPEILDL